MSQKIDFNKNFYSNKNKINRVKKMDKKIILKIQLIIQDIVTNTDICNTELEENRPEIKEVVLELDQEKSLRHLLSRSIPVCLLR